MKIFLLTGLILLNFFWGCGSKVPIADVSESITDDRVVGDWQASNEKEILKLKVLKFNDKEYLAHSKVKDKYKEDKAEEHYFRFYILDINDQSFINAQDINTADPENRVYHFFRYQVRSDSSVFVESLNDIDSVKINDFENPKYRM